MTVCGFLARLPPVFAADTAANGACKYVGSLPAAWRAACTAAGFVVKGQPRRISCTSATPHAHSPGGIAADCERQLARRVPQVAARFARLSPGSECAQGKSETWLTSCRHRGCCVVQQDRQCPRVRHGMHAPAGTDLVARWLPPSPRQVLVLADSKEARQVVPKWHSTPSGVLIVTHEMFAMLGALHLFRNVVARAAWWAGRLQGDLWVCSHEGCGRSAEPSSTSLAPVTNATRGRKLKSQRSMSASGAQLQELEAAAAAAAAGQQPAGPDVAQMLRDGPSVVVVDEAHVMKTDTVRACLLVLWCCAEAPAALRACVVQPAVVPSSILSRLSRASPACRRCALGRWCPSRPSAGWP